VGRLRAGAGPAGVLGAALVAWGLAEPLRLVIRREELAVPHWPDALDGLTVALVADLHAGGLHARPKRIRKMAEQIAAERPDLVLLLGDYVDFDLLTTRRLPFTDVAAALAPLGAAPLGRVAVLGNHDWKHGGGPMRRALAQHGITVLENEAVRVGEGERALWLAGLADMRMRAPDITAALAEVPDGAPVIALSHDPDLFALVPPRVSLTVSGHTHGGQIRLPGLTRFFLPSREGMRYRHGLIRERGRMLWITAGIGEAGVPMRFRQPREAVLLTLRPSR
jgi:predicted MPP superfamily phosphohydrolase